MRALETPLTPDLLATVALHMDPTPAFHQSFWSNTRMLTRRQLLVTRRNTAFLRSRGVMVVVMALLYTSTLFDVDPANMQVALGVMFQTIHFLAFGQMAQVPTYMAARDVFYKHRRANFVRSAAYVVASVVSQLPIALSESLIVGSLVYWLCGFVASASAFTVFMMLLVLTHMALAAWFLCRGARARPAHSQAALAPLDLRLHALGRLRGREEPHARLLCLDLLAQPDRVVHACGGCEPVPVARVRRVRVRRCGLLRTVRKASGSIS